MDMNSDDATSTTIAQSY